MIYNYNLINNVEDQVPLLTGKGINLVNFTIVFEARKETTNENNQFSNKKEWLSYLNMIEKRRLQYF